MVTFFEPPVLLTLAVVLAGGAGTLYFGLRPALRGPLPVVTSERDEVWGVEDPPPPPKRPYVYPADRPSPAPVPRSDDEPEPLARMPASPTVAPLFLAAQPATAMEIDDFEAAEAEDVDEEEGELSLADLFRPKRRAHARSHAAPNDAPTQD